MFHEPTIAIGYALGVLSIALGVAYLFATGGLDPGMRREAKGKPGFKVMAGAGVALAVVGAAMLFSPPAIYGQMARPDEGVADIMGVLLSAVPLTLGTCLYFGAWIQFGARRDTRTPRSADGDGGAVEMTRGHGADGAQATSDDLTSSEPRTRT